MSRPMGDEEGSAWIELHSDGSKLPAEMERDVKKAAEAVESDMDDVGDGWGKEASKGMGDRLKSEGPAIAKKLEEGLRRSKVTTKVRVEYDKDNNIVRRFEETVVTSLQDAFDAASKPGGPVSKIGQGLADAIGSGFNVSGKSPLIGFFALLVGAIGALVVAAIQAVNALIALSFTLPQILTGLALSAGVLALAFDGMGSAISNAFAAKNAKELKKALQDLQPSARAFVMELLPLKNIFERLKIIAQENFFKAFAGSVSNLLDTFNRTGFFLAVRDLAEALGTFLHQIADFLANPTFASFVKETIPLTISWLRQFGPSFTHWLDSLFNFFRKMEPLLKFFGEWFGQNFDDWARFFDRLSEDPEMQKWLDSAKETLQLLEDLVFSIVDFAKQFMQTLDEAGGKESLKEIIDLIDELTFFFSTDVAKEGLKGFIDSCLFALKAVAGLFMLIIIIFAGLRLAVVSIGQFLQWLGGLVVDAGKAIGKFFEDLWKDIVDGGDQKLLGFFRSLGGKIVDIFADAGSWLFNAGQKIIGGLIAGMRSMQGDLAGHMGKVGTKIKDNLPSSPAKEGPLSGRGDPLYAGQKIIQRLGMGMDMAIPQLQAASNNMASNVVFGPGAIQQNFQGLPTQTQATGIGRGVGAGIGDSLLGRDVRLAVRAL